MGTSPAAALHRLYPSPNRQASVAGRCRFGFPSCLDELREDAANALWVNEGDARSMQADPRLRVDQLETGGSRISHRFVDVVHRHRDVVQARSSFGEKLADRRVLTQRCEELDLGAAGTEEGRRQSVRL